MASPSLDEATTKEVLRQVEFYFSDSNIPRDKFMRSTIESSDDGLVSLALICSFKKMRGYLKLGEITPDQMPEDTLKAVADTLRKSGFLKVSEDGKKVGRLVPLSSPEEVIEQLDARTVAASPLKYNVKLEDVESFFGQYAKVASVRMPRNVADKKFFCGTALIEFSTEEDADKALQHNFVFDGVQLEIKPKKDFDAERAKLAEETENSQQGSGRNSNFDPETNYPKGLIVAFTLKRISAEESVEQGISKESESNDANAEGDGVNMGDNASKGPDEVSDKVVEDEGSPGVSNSEHNGNGNGSKAIETEGGDTSSLVAIEKDEGKKEHPNARDCKNNKDIVMREDLKAVLEKFGKVKFIDFKMGEDSGYVRFEEPEAAQKARAAAVLAKEGGLLVKNFIATLEPVHGDAEKEYWKLLRDGQGKHRGNFQKGGRGRGGGRHHGGKHPRSRDRDFGGRPNKSQKVGA